jgi:hypothetical protein
MINERPLFGGMEETNFFKEARPPAEAPKPTTKCIFFDLDMDFYRIETG